MCVSGTGSYKFIYSCVKDEKREPKIGEEVLIAQYAVQFTEHKFSFNC